MSVYECEDVCVCVYTVTYLTVGVRRLSVAVGTQE